MWEYRIIIDNKMEVQKILNQWRHDYDLQTLHMHVNVDGIITLLIRRKSLMPNRKEIQFKHSITPTKKPRIAPHSIKIGRFMGFVRFQPTDHGAQMIIEIAFHGMTPDELAQHQQRLDGVRQMLSGE